MSSTTEATPQATTRGCLSARALVKQYGRRKVVNGVDLDVHTGEIVGLLGPNGAGKTTSFYMMVGLTALSAGSVRLDDRDVTHYPMFRRARMGMGYLPQEASVFRKLTVRDNLVAIAETLRVSRAERQRRVDALLEELGLQAVAGQRAYTLSGGERRRLEICRALLSKPRFLLMDEPFSGVDPISVSDVQAIILQLRERDIGVLITDHNVRETLRIVDRAYLLHDGKVLCSGSTQELLDHPASRQFYLGADFQL